MTRDEIWTTRDGTEIAVGDMSEGHVRNALRMILRKRREAEEKRMLVKYDLEELHCLEGDGQDFLNDQYRRDLRDPAIFFPLLDGGVHGSEALYEKYSGSI